MRSDAKAHINISIYILYKIVQLSHHTHPLAPLAYLVFLFQLIICICALERFLVVMKRTMHAKRWRQKANNNNNNKGHVNYHSKNM